MRWPFRRVLVEGPSMAPALRAGDQLLAWMWTIPRPRPEAIVVVELPGARGLAVKRMRHVDAAGGLWVEGDNAFGSTDSRSFGALPPAALRGRALVRLWPRPGRIPARRPPDGPPQA